MTERAPLGAEASGPAPGQRYGMTDSPPAAVLDGLATAAAALCAVPLALIGYRDPADRWFEFTVGTPEAREAGETGFCARVMREREGLVEVADAARDERYRADPPLAGEPTIRFCAGQRVALPDGSVVGALCVFDRVPRRLCAVQREGLARFARIVSELLAGWYGSRVGAIDRAVEQATAHGLLITDPTLPDNPIVHVNRATQRMTGYSKTELLGRNCRLLQGPDTDPEAVARLRRAISARRSVTVVLKNYRKDGTAFMNEVTVSPVHDGAGAIVNFVGLQQDVTSRQLAEERAERLAAASLEIDRTRVSRDRLARIMELSVNGIHVLDAGTFRILEANRTARTNLGRSLEELRQLSARDWVDVIDGQSVESMIASLRREPNHSLVRTGALRRKDGSTYPVECRLQLIDAETPPVILAICQDITNRLKFEERARVRERAIEAIELGVTITDATRAGHPLVYVNRGLCEMFGYARDELLGREVGTLRGTDRDHARLRRIEASLQRGESVQVELESTRKDGSRFMNELSLSPVHNDAGKLTHYIGINRDVSDRLESEARLRRSQKIEAVGQLSGGVAHDFNNLLSVIAGNLEFLDAELLDENQRTCLDEAATAVRMGARLTRRLLDFAQNSALDPVVLDVNEQVDVAVALLRSTIEEHIDFEIALSPDVWRVRADASGIESAVVNLVINARDAMPRGGRISVVSRNTSFSAENIDELGMAPGDYVQVSIADTGSGMTPEVQAHVFEPFFTTKEPGKGTGLGLASVYGFAKQSGGHVSVYSEAGRGTVVHLYLPRHVEPAAATPIERPAAPDLAGGEARVLVVEDNAMVLRVTVKRLEALGFEVLAARDGAEAVRLLERGARPDLVLTDIVMSGGLSGYDVARWVREHLPRCAILLSSGFDRKMAEACQVEVEGLRLLQKPYDLAELKHALRAALDDAATADEPAVLARGREGASS